MRPIASLFLFLALLWSLVSGIIIADPLPPITPASIPLAVRSPYLSVWHNSVKGSQPLSSSWPTFWTQTGPDIGWRGKIRIDSVVYGWLGNDLPDGPNANVTSVQITPTRSVFLMQAGPMNLTVTFLSPIEPDDWVKQSLPFSYLTIQVTSTDDQTHDVQVYSDITASQWLSSNATSPARWSSKVTGSSVFHEMELENPQANAQVNERSQDGKVYFAMSSTPSMTWQIDVSPVVDVQFAGSGRLTNQAADSTGLYPLDFLVFAFAVDFGEIRDSDPTTWSVGYVRSPSVLFTTSSGATEERVPYFTTQYEDIADAIDAFTGDSQAAYSRAVVLDKKIMDAAAAVSSAYTDIVSLATRQTLGALDITVSNGSDGKTNASDVKIFMKDVGTSQRVDPVEKMYAALPALLYLNASFVGGLLTPLLDVQDNKGELAYAAQDLGLSYPIASGTRGAHQQGIEQTGNMLIMLYAHARTSGNGALLAQHYNLIKGWADYLANNSLSFENQVSADGENAANMTNLGIKGIVGVKAMAEISRALGEGSDANSYENRATEMAETWLSLSTASQGNVSVFYEVYNNQTALNFALDYNLYADRLLGTNLVPTGLINNASLMYQIFFDDLIEQAPPIDRSIPRTSSAAWLIFVSAFMTNQVFRDQFIDGVWVRASSNTTVGAFPDVFDSITGAALGGSAGPSLGAMYAHLALTVPNRTIIVPQNNDESGGSNANASHSRLHLAPVLGGAIGGTAFLSLVAAGAMYLIRRRRRRLARGDMSEKIDILESPRRRPLVLPFQAYEAPASAFQLIQEQDDSPRSAGGADAGLLLHDADAPSPSAYQSSRDGTDPTAVSLPIATAPTHSAVKAREAGLYPVNGPASDVASTVGPSMMVDEDPFRSPTLPLTRSGSRSQGVAGLRVEVERLREEIKMIRNEQSEPLPEYVQGLS